MILSDEVIPLAAPRIAGVRMLKDMRLVTSKNRKGQVHKLVTNRQDLTAIEAVTLCRKRWQIKLFFCWLQSLHATALQWLMRRH